jgi:hypothetical protein
VIEHLTTNCEALGQIPSTAKKKKKIFFFLILQRQLWKLGAMLGGWEVARRKLYWIV